MNIPSVNDFRERLSMLSPYSSTAPQDSKISRLTWILARKLAFFQFCLPGRLGKMKLLLLCLLLTFPAGAALPVVLTSQVGTHSIESIADSGGVIVLDDESVWGIQVVDRVDSGVWLESDDVMVKRTNEDPNYPYLLINTDEHETVHAKYMGKP